jgi:hypothetical protein
MYEIATDDSLRPSVTLLARHPRTLKLFVIRGEVEQYAGIQCIFEERENVFYDIVTGAALNVFTFTKYEAIKTVRDNVKNYAPIDELRTRFYRNRGTIPFYFQKKRVLKML